MSGLWSAGVALGLVGAGAFAGLVADRFAKIRRTDGERGDFWAGITRRTSLVLGIPLLLSLTVIHLLPDPVAGSGWHLQADRTGFQGGSPAHAYLFLIALPWVIWALLLVLGVMARPRGREGRFLAGAIGSGTSRSWVLACAVPLLVPLMIGFFDLGGGPDAYPGAVWSSLAAIVLSLTGVALSAGRPGEAPETAPDSKETESTSLPPWPETLRQRGLTVQTLATWDATPPERRPRGATARDLEDRLTHRGAPDLAPELLEAVSRLLRPGLPAPTQARSDAPLGPAELVIAPDGCGQEEAVAGAAEVLAERFREITLVVTARHADVLADRLRLWVAASHRTSVQVVGAAAELPQNAWLWVVEAEKLSDRLMEQLQGPKLRQIGLVVWWELERYSGVLGANLWAISRRLHRLLRREGRPDVRTLALIRSAAYGEAQLDAFVRRLLPHSFPDAHQTQIGARFSRQVQLHLLGSGPGETIRKPGEPDAVHHVALRATRVSLEAGWPTGLDRPEDLALTDVRPFRQQTLQGAPLGEQLRPSRMAAAAWIERLPESEVLSLVERSCQGGRCALAAIHHEGLLPPHNPYAAHLLDRLRHEGLEALRASRRLVNAQGHPNLVERHLRLALDEASDVRGNLLKDFLLDEQLIRQTLDKLHHDGKLQASEVRTLSPEGDLVRDTRYTISRAADPERQSLDTVSHRLIRVRAPEEAHEEDGVRLQVDPERLVIAAYPSRVFQFRGRRYQVASWSREREILDRGWVDCRLQSEYRITWRVKRSFLLDLNPRPLRDWTRLGGRVRRLARRVVAATYEEEVSGILELTRDPAVFDGPVPAPTQLDRPVATRFQTQALILHFSDPPPLLGLSSLAQVFRHMLPVHVGVEPDALEVVTLHGERIGEDEAHGLGIADLYPGGIGLIEALEDDRGLLLDLLGRARKWLEACPCQSDAGCARCLRSPASHAANPDEPARRDAALDLLHSVLEPV